MPKEKNRQPQGTLPEWLGSVEEAAKKFAASNRVMLKWTDRQLSAAFEIGCFHALLNFYLSQSYELSIANLVDNEYRYLTSPAGNPANFSYVVAAGVDGTFEIRQQVRVESHIHTDIAFTPDIVVLRSGSDVEASYDEDYAGGRRKFFKAKSSAVVAAHECKSLNPFPELLVAFIGMFVAAHEWRAAGSSVSHSSDKGHLAPTLFVGGAARALHAKMISAMQNGFDLNIICGMHQGTWDLQEAKNRLLIRGLRTSVIETPAEELPDF